MPEIGPAEETRKKFGRWLGAKRRRLKISQADLAREVGANKSVIANTENGRRHPDLDECHKLAHAVGGSAEEAEEVLIETLIALRCPEVWDRVEYLFSRGTRGSPTRAEMRLLRQLREAKARRPEMPLERLLGDYLRSIEQRSAPQSMDWEKEPWFMSAELLGGIPAEAQDELIMSWHHLLRSFYRAHRVVVDMDNFGNLGWNTAFPTEPPKYCSQCGGKMKQLPTRFGRPRRECPACTAG